MHFGGNRRADQGLEEITLKAPDFLPKGGIAARRIFPELQDRLPPPCQRPDLKAAKIFPFPCRFRDADHPDPVFQYPFQIDSVFILTDGL